MIEFVVFDREGNEVDWVDPVVSYAPLENVPGVFRVDNGYGVYEVEIPTEGRYEIRTKEATDV